EVLTGEELRRLDACALCDLPLEFCLGRERLVLRPEAELRHLAPRCAGRLYVDRVAPARTVVTAGAAAPRDAPVALPTASEDAARQCRLLACTDRSFSIVRAGLYSIVYILCACLHPLGSSSRCSEHGQSSLPESRSRLCHRNRGPVFARLQRPTGAFDLGGG